jgi:hypothetical protein
MSETTSPAVLLRARIGAYRDARRKRRTIGSTVSVWIEAFDEVTDALLPIEGTLAALYWLPTLADYDSPAQSVEPVQTVPGQWRVDVPGEMVGTYTVQASLLLGDVTAEAVEIQFDIDSLGGIAVTSTGEIPWAAVSAAGAAAGASAGIAAGRSAGAASGAEAGAAAGASAGAASAAEIAVEAVAPAVQQVTQAAATVATQAGEVAGNAQAAQEAAEAASQSAEQAGTAGAEAGSASGAEAGSAAAQAVLNAKADIAALDEATTFTAGYTGAAPRPLKDWAADGGPSIRDWRLSTDPVNDWGSTIDRAAQAVSNAGGGSLRVPVGVFVLDQPHTPKSGVILTGSDRRQAILQKSGGSNTFDLIHISGAVSNIALRELGLDGNRRAQTDAAAAQSTIAIDDPTTTASDCRIERCRIWQWSQQGMGVHVKGYRGVILHDNDIEDGGDPSLYHAIYTRRCSDVAVTWNRIKNALGQGVKVVDNQVSAYDCLVAYNRIEGGNRGIAVSDVDDVTVIGNRIYNMVSEGIRLGTESEPSLTNAQILSNRIAFAGDGIVLVAAHRTIVQGNVIREATASGIQINGTIGTNVEGNAVINTITPIPAGQGVHQITVPPSGACSNLKVIGNHLRLGVGGGTSRNGINIRGSGHTDVTIADNAFEGGGFTTREASSVDYKISPHRVMRVATGKVDDTTPLPTSATGLTSGTLWNNGGVVNVVP